MSDILPRLVGIDHVALEVGDIEEALAVVDDLDLERIALAKLQQMRATR